MKAELPCEANWWEWENLDNLDTFWHDQGMYRKYGYGRFVSQISVDIRSGLISRSDALKLSHQYDGFVSDTYCGLSIYDSADRIGLSKEEMWKCLDKFTNWDLFNDISNNRLLIKEADWLKCPFCNKYDDPNNLYIYPNKNAGKHRECFNKYRKEHVALCKDYTRSAA